MWPYWLSTASNAASANGNPENVEVFGEGRAGHPHLFLGAAHIAGERRRQHQGPHTFGMAGTEQHRGKRRLRHGEDRHAFAAGRVEHREEPVGPGLDRREVGDRYRVGLADAEEVGGDQAAERRQPAQGPATVGSSHSRSIGKVAVGTKSRSAPLSPTTW